MKKQTYKEQISNPNWQKKGLEIFKRDNFECQFCKSKDKTLHTHHLIYTTSLKIWEYDDELLITLCPECHQVITELNKIISLIALQVVKKKIDLVILSELIEKSK